MKKLTEYEKWQKRVQAIEEQNLIEEKQNYEEEIQEYRNRNNFFGFES